jgi:ferredoxin
MPRRRPAPDWTPDPAQMALMPPVSGNAVNGLGEAAARRPRRVYWAADPATIAHGAVQQWFYRRNADPEMAAERARRMALAVAPPVPVAARRPDRSAAEWTAALRAQAAALGAAQVGIARLDPGWVFEGEALPWGRVVLVSVEMAAAPLAEAPGPAAAREVMRGYTRAVAVSRGLADWLHAEGVPAAAETGPMANALSMLPAAIAAGFGELGRHGSLIGRRLGSRFRLAAVLADLDLVEDAPDVFGADGFCTHCRICSEACPPQAILPDRQMVRGVTRWYVDFDRCLPFFNETAGCAICVSVCPFSDPAHGPALAAKLERRQARKG